MLLERWIRVGATTTAGLAATVVTAVALGTARWKRDTARLVERLELQAATFGNGATDETFSTDRLAGLPAPVARYFAFALTPGQSLVRRARVRWSGEFRATPHATWSPFSAHQWFTTGSPGFVWDASIRMMPLMPVRVRDGYVEGEGVMVGKLAALVPVADVHGTPEMAAGALSRYLGEAVWFPTALLPSAGVRWSPIDDRSARATLSDGKTTVSADFRFGSRGEIVGVSMTRYRDVGGRGIPTPFKGRVGPEYRRVSGMMIPFSGEVAWLLPDGEFTYWRGRIDEATYDSRW